MVRIKVLVALHPAVAVGTDMVAVPKPGIQAAREVESWAKQPADMSCSGGDVAKLLL